MLDPSTTHGSNPPAPPLSRSRLLLRHRIAIVLLALLGVIGVGWSVRRAVATSGQVEHIGYTELLARGSAGDVEKAEIDGERVTLRMKNGSSALAVVSNGHSQHAMVQVFAERKVPVEFLPRDATGERTLNAILPPILLLSLVG